MAIIEELDSHQTAPEALTRLCKRYQKLSPDQVSRDRNVIDVHQVQAGCEDHRVQVTGSISVSQILDACKNSGFDSGIVSDGSIPCLPSRDEVNIFAVEGFQGRHILLSLQNPQSHCYGSHADISGSYSPKGTMADAVRSYAFMSCR